MLNCLGSTFSCIGSCLSGTDNSQPQPPESGVGATPVQVPSFLPGGPNIYQPVPGQALDARSVAYPPAFPMMPMMQSQSGAMKASIDKLQDGDEYSKTEHKSHAKTLADQLDNLQKNIESQKSGPNGAMMKTFSAELDSCLGHKCGWTKTSLGQCLEKAKSGADPVRGTSSQIQEMWCDFQEGLGKLSDLLDKCQPYGL